MNKYFHKLKLIYYLNFEIKKSLVIEISQIGYFYADVAKAASLS